MHHLQRIGAAIIVVLLVLALAAPMARHARRPRNCAPARITMLAPITQITCKWM